MSPLKSFSGTLIDDEFRLSLEDLCHACHRERGWAITLIEEGILQPRGKGPSDWFFDNLDMLHARRVMRLQRDLQVNLAGAAVIVQLLDKMQALQHRLGHVDDDITDIKTPISLRAG